MCGIFSLLNNNSTFTPIFVEQQFKKGKERGPEFSKLSQVGLKIMMGFHRLAINGLNDESNQPIIDGDIVLICNGEIYNYKELYRYMNIQQKTNSDCEIIIHLYKKYGIEHTLQMLDGVFSFVLLDNSTDSESFKMFVARDPYGVRPLFALTPTQHNSTEEKYQIIGFASEMKSLYEFYKYLTENNVEKKRKPKLKAGVMHFEEDKLKPKYTLKPFLPGTYSAYELSSKVFSCWTVHKENYRYHSTGFNSIMYHLSPQYYDSEIVMNIQRYLIRAIEKRCCSTERPMACLLSGGLDSSIIAGLVRQYHVTHELPQFETYSIGLEGSEDLKYAKLVSEHLGTKHTEVIVTEADFLNAIPEVIKAIESYDTTTVRASIGNYLLGKYIAKHSEAKVIFNGDGADELCGGYLYMYLANESIEFDREVRRLLSDIHLFDVLRSDRSVACNGLESRSPFLDRSFVQYYLSIPPQTRFHTRNEQCEKYLLRLAFSSEYYRNSSDGKLLPDEVLWRTKEAFSDGVSCKSRSLYEIIQEHANHKFVEEHIHTIPKVKFEDNIYTEISKGDPVLKNVNGHLVPKTAEQYMYRKEFEKHYSGMGPLIPYFWMPKYAEKITDPSARTLEIYNDEENKEEENENEEEENKKKDNEEELLTNSFVANKI
jgi:asparagine synthase (glutamine-hydrolysing)